MTPEEKELLLKDLSARIPYQPLCKITDTEYDFCECDRPLGYSLRDFVGNNVIIKLYLRPMSSMTEEEKKELKNVTCPNGTGYFNEQHLVCPVNHYGEQISFDFMSNIIDWLNAHHFDFRGLIEKGFALEAPEEMYKTE